MAQNIPPPPIAAPQELRDYSAEHLVYEIEMLFGAVPKGGPSAAGPITMTTQSSATTTRSVLLSSSPVRSFNFNNNARIEAFANHLRNLITFLYPDEYPLSRLSKYWWMDGAV